MLFNSIDFVVFLPIVFGIYWLVGKSKLVLQNLFIVFASYFFYGWWDWRFLSLIFFSTVVDYSIGFLMSKEENQSKRKLLLSLSLFVNLGFLGFFKYYNFFQDNFINAFSFFGNDINPSSLNIILPVGISFYTFQTLSYTIDIYRRKLKPANDFIGFAAFVSFFPQLVAGPIERATNLLPQFYKERVFEYDKAVDGLRQILWGLFKKIVIADNCATFVNLIFNSPGDYSGSTLLLGAIFFTFQIYGDFSGYSDIAIGVSRLFGFNLMQNFSFPYFSRDIAEFWRRWHISLSTWFRDYLYIPLGGSRGGTWMKVRNTFIIFIVSGFWHGANWTFVIWGGLNAIYFLPLIITKRNRNNLGVVAEGKIIPTFRDMLSMLITFGLTVIAWVFFRAESVEYAVSYLSRLFSSSLFTPPSVASQNTDILILILLSFFFIIVEWLGRENKHALENIKGKLNQFLVWGSYMFIAILIFIFQGDEQQFIYFQF